MPFLCRLCSTVLYPLPSMAPRGSADSGSSRLSQPVYRTRSLIEPESIHDLSILIPKPEHNRSGASSQALSVAAVSCIVCCCICACAPTPWSVFINQCDTTSCLMQPRRSPIPLQQTSPAASSFSRRLSPSIALHYRAPLPASSAKVHSTLPPPLH